MNYKYLIIKLSSQRYSIDREAITDKSLLNKWDTLLNSFPKEFQAEILDEEWSNAKNDEQLKTAINTLSTYSLKSPKPVKKLVKEILMRNLDVLSNLQDNVREAIAKKYSVNIPRGKWVDYQKEHYGETGEKDFEYAKLPANTAKPITLVNDKLTMGNHRFSAALLRGDKYIMAWDFNGKTNQERMKEHGLES